MNPITTVWCTCAVAQTASLVYIAYKSGRAIDALTNKLELEARFTQISVQKAEKTLAALEAASKEEKDD